MVGLLLWLPLPVSAQETQEAQFACPDGAGGTVTCVLQRGDGMTQAACEGPLFKVKWVCTAFPDLDTALCRSQSYGQRSLALKEYGVDRFLCTSLCYCPAPKF